MEEIKYHKNIDLKDPVMIAGWPGMGNVALGVVEAWVGRLTARARRRVAEALAGMGDSRG